MGGCCKNKCGPAYFPTPFTVTGPTGPAGSSEVYTAVANGVTGNTGIGPAYVRGGAGLIGLFVGGQLLANPLGATTLYVPANLPWSSTGGNVVSYTIS